MVKSYHITIKASLGVQQSVAFMPGGACASRHVSLGKILAGKAVALAVTELWTGTVKGRVDL